MPSNPAAPSDPKKFLRSIDMFPHKCSKAKTGSDGVCITMTGLIASRTPAETRQWHHVGMRFWSWISAFVPFICCCTGAPAQESPAISFSVPPADAPELAPRGRWPVGVRTLDLVNPGQVDILHFDPLSGKAPLYDRPLKIEVWYPAVIPAGKEERVIYESAMPGAPAPDVPKTFRIPARHCAMLRRREECAFRW